MTNISLIDVEERPTVALRRQVRTDALADFFAGVFDEVSAQLERAGIQIGGAPFARYRGVPGDVADIEAGFPLTAPWPGGADGELLAGTLPTARAVEAVHQGSYDTLRETYQALEAFVAEHNLHLQEEWWEIYDSGPSSDQDPGTWRTRIVWPIEYPQVTSD